MLSLSPAVKIFLATEPADMRKSVDGLQGLVEEVLEQDPYSGYLFVFRNRRSDRIKILVWDHGGFWVLYRRLEKGRFRFPDLTGSSAQVEAAELASLLAGIDLSGARRLPRWSPPAPLRLPTSHTETGSQSGLAA
jgi:transposase